MSKTPLTPICIIICLIFSSVQLIGAMPPQAIQHDYAKVKAATYLEQTKMRSLPSHDSDLLREVPANETVEVLELSLGDYCQVRYKGTIGYVLRKELIFEGKNEIEINIQGDGAFGTESGEQPVISLDADKVVKPRIYHKGPRGGCYFYNAEGVKKYAERYLCD